MHVRQVLVGASPGDAVTNIALAIAELLPESVSCSIWAMHFDPGLGDRVRHVELMPGPDEVDPDDVVLYHASIGEPAVADVVRHRPERLGIYFHNITPARFFVGLDDVFARRLESGRGEVRTLLGRADFVITPSEFNAEEVRSWSSCPVVVAPPPLDLSRLMAVESHEPTRHHLEVAVPMPIIVSVGQLLPHKRPELLISAMSILSSELGVGAHLVMVGAHRNAAYAAALQRLVDDLALRHVTLVGACSDEELVAYLRAASVFATATAHEGFGVPIVEAFAFGLPVVATAGGAVPETAGRGALVLPVDAGPILLAEALAAVVHEPATRERLVGAGRRELERFDHAVTSAATAEALRTCLA